MFKVWLVYLVSTCYVKSQWGLFILYHILYSMTIKYESFTVCQFKAEKSYICSLSGCIEKKRTAANWY